MDEQQIKDAISSFHKAWTAGDTKQAVTFFADDAVWVTPQGTFKGISQIEKNAAWVNKIVKNYAITRKGIDIIVQGDAAVVEHSLSGTTNGMKWEVPAVSIYEFRNGKMANVRVFFDVLSQSQQVAKGIGKRVVNIVVSESRKGLK